MSKIVLIRHGESLWNKANRFTGWVDVGLTEKGKQEALKAGKLLKKEGFTFDIAFTSVLKRAIKTLDIVLEEMDLMWLPVIKSWRLNERHYGALQGLNKAETAAKHGEKQVLIWRRSYDISPPALDPDDEKSASKDRRYNNIKNIPMTENLKLTVERFLPYWHKEIAPLIKQGKQIIVAAHGNSLRALVKYLDNISEKDIVNLNIPTGIPLVYELDDKKDLQTIKSYYLGDPEQIKKAAEAVKNQGKT